MIEHHIQQAILYRLAFAESLKFSELKPDGMENKLFTYHLKKTILEGLVEKTNEGTYKLTSEGKRIGKTSAKSFHFIDSAYSILFLAVRRQTDGAWLLFRRKSQPLLGLTGFMQATPSINEGIVQTAKTALAQKTGLTGDFYVKSSGFLKVFKDEKIESFTNFTLLVCKDAKGNLDQKDHTGDYFWAIDPDFSDKSMLPTVATLASMVDSQESFAEKTFYC